MKCAAAIAMLCCSLLARADVNYSIVRLTTPSEGQSADLGAGVIVGSDDRTIYVATAGHVVDAPKLQIRAQLYGARDRDFPGRLLADFDPSLDVRIVAVEIAQGDAIRRSLRPLLYRAERLTSETLLANIAHIVAPWQLNRGNALQEEQRNNILFSPRGVTPGASGGPLLDEQQRLVGLVTDVTVTHATALRIDAILDFLERTKLPANLLTDWQAPRLPPEDDTSAIFADRFEDNRNGWRLSTDPEAPGHVAGGVYVLGEKLGGFGRIPTVPIAIDTGRDFEISCTVTKVRGSNSQWYGLVWGFQDENHFFNFAITADGHVAVTKKAYGVFKDYTDTRLESPHVRKFDATNRLLIRRRGKRLSFLINDHQVHEMPFQKLFGPQIGFIVYQAVQLAFDDLVVKQAPATRKPPEAGTNNDTGENNLADMPEVSNTCSFLTGPRAGQIQRFSQAAPIAVGNPCHDGLGSFGTAISETTKKP